MSLHFRLARDTVGVMVIQALSMGLGFAVSVVLARLLGVREFGLYSLAMSVLGLLVVPATLGFPQLLVREIAAYRVKEEWGLIRGLLRFAQCTSLLASLGIALLGGLVLWGLSSRLSREAMQVLALAFAALPFWALLELQEASLRGFDQILAGQWVKSAMRPLCFLIIIGIAWLLFREIRNASLALGLHILATGIASAFAFYLLRGQLHRSAPSSNASQNTTVWIRSSLHLTFLALLNLIPQHAGILMLGWMRSSEEVGLYKVALQTASLIPLGLMTVNIAIAPMLTQLYVSGNKNHLRQVLAIATSVASVMALPLILACILRGGWILEHLFGNAYAGGATALAILSVGFFFNVATGVLWHLMIMTGYEQKTLVILSTSVVINLIINLIIIPIWGAKGTALAQTIALIINALLTVYTAKWRWK